MDEYWEYSADEYEADMALLKELNGCAIQILDDNDFQANVQIPSRPAYNFESKLFVRINNEPVCCSDCRNEFVNFKNYYHDKEYNKSICNMCYNNKY